MKSLILKEVNRFTVTFIYIYGFYVILNGHLSPGGGFAGGTILSAGMILYKMAYPEYAKQLFTQSFITRGICGAILVYGILKSYHIFHGIYGHHEAAKAASYTIWGGGSLVVLNVCVGVIVAGTFYSLTCLFLEGEV